MSVSNSDPGAYLDLQSGDALERILSSARYAQVGRVADSVTHDINNLLGASMAYAEIVALETGVSDEGRRMLAQVVGSAMRCSELITCLTSLTRKESLVAKPANVIELFQRTIGLDAFMMRRVKIALEQSWPERETTIVGDPARLQLAFSHMLSNAREALELESVESRVVRIGLELLGEHDAALTVWNSGPEISVAVREHMFAAFYTTRPTPHLGLGLFAARQAAELHDGSLDYVPGNGFVFRFSRYPAFARKRVVEDVV